MGTTLGTAYVQIVPSAQGIKGSITDVLGGEAESAGTSVGSKIGSFAKKALAAAAIGTVMVKGMKAAMDEGAKLQQSYLGGVDTLYGKAAEQVRAYAREASKAGISMNDYSEQAVSFGAALKQAFGGDVVKAAEVANMAIMDMADNSAKMGTDISSVQMAYQGFAKQNYTMLDNLKLGYGGTREEMLRLLADAEALTGVKYDINNLGDVYEAIHVIQGELGLTGVAAAEASETFSGSFNAMKAAAANALGSIALGEGVKPALQQLAQSVSTFFFGNFIPMLGTIIKALPSAIVAFLQTGLPLLVSGISSLINSVMVQIKSLADGITASSVAEWATTTLPQIIAAGTQLIGGLVQTLLTNIPQILAAIVQIGVAVAAGLLSAIGSALAPAKAALITKWNEIKTDAQNAWNALTSAASTAWNTVKTNITEPIEKLKAELGSKWNDIKSKAETAWNSMKSAASTAWNAVKTAITSPIDTLESALSQKWSGIKSAASTAWEKIKSAMIKPIEAAKDKIDGIIDKIKGFFPISIGNVMNNLKLPHFSISGKFSINPPSVPKFSISWYRKGGIVPDAAVFGAVGMGEAGPEAILPLDPFWKKLDEQNAEQSHRTEAMLAEVLQILLSIYEEGKKPKDFKVDGIWAGRYINSMVR